MKSSPLYGMRRQAVQDLSRLVGLAVRCLVP